MEHSSVRRFCIECLLCFIECDQLQAYIQEHCLDDQALPNVHHVATPSNVPTSLIVEKESSAETMLEAKRKALKLYEKYIACGGSDLQINICSRLRTQFDDLFNYRHKHGAHEVNLQDLVLLFERVKREMLEYMVQSFRRFKNKADYVAILPLISMQDGTSKIEEIEVVTIGATSS